MVIKPLTFATTSTLALQSFRGSCLHVAKRAEKSRQACFSCTCRLVRRAQGKNRHPRQRQPGHTLHRSRRAAPAARGVLGAAGVSCAVLLCCTIYIYDSTSRLQ